MNAQLTIEEQNVEQRHFEDLAAEVTRAGGPTKRLSFSSRPSIRRLAQPRNDWIHQVGRQLQAIARLPAGWDSRGGARADLETIDSAWILLVQVASADASLPKPNINPTPSGGAQFHWESGSRYFEIDVIAPGMAQYYFVDRDAESEAEGELRYGDFIDILVEYARRVETQP